MASARFGKKNDGADSGKLDRTLKDIESAFADWESLGTRKVRSAAENAAENAEDKRKMKDAEQSAKEFQTRTQTLLDQLCKQLSELGD